MTKMRGFLIKLQIDSYPGIELQQLSILRFSESTVMLESERKLRPTKGLT